MEGQGYAHEDADRRLLPAAQLGAVEQQQGRADHQDAGEDVGHGEGGHPRQAGAKRERRHQGVIGPARRFGGDGAPQQEDHPGAGQGLDRGQQPQRAPMGQGVEDDAVIGRAGADVGVVEVLVPGQQVGGLLLLGGDRDRRLLVQEGSPQRLIEAGAVDHVVARVGEHARPSDDSHETHDDQRAENRGNQTRKTAGHRRKLEL